MQLPQHSVKKNMPDYMNAHRFQTGDRIKHRQRPEWGLGTVTKAEDMAANGKTAQRLSIRFPGIGVKVLNTGFAQLEVVSKEDAREIATTGVVRSRKEIMESNGNEEPHWLAPVAEQQLEQKLQSIPEEARDRFNSIKTRLRVTFDLYRFDRSGKGLMDWAVAQTGLDDPLSTFTRHELEVKFDRWVAAREDHLKSLLQDGECTDVIVRELLAAAPPKAAEVVRRLSARR